MDDSSSTAPVLESGRDSDIESSENGVLNTAQAGSDEAKLQSSATSLSGCGIDPAIKPTINASLQAYFVENDATPDQTPTAVQQLTSAFNSLLTLSLDNKAPTSLNIVRELLFQPDANTPIPQFINLLESEILPLEQKASMPSIFTLGLFLANGFGDEVPEEHVKSEVRAFAISLKSSATAQQEITHLDVGWKHVLHDLLREESRCEGCRHRGRRTAEEDVERQHPHPK